MATKKSEINYKSAQKVYDSISVRFRKDCGIKEALSNRADITGVPVATFIQQTVINKLVDEGYLPVYMSTEPQDE